MFYGQTTRDGAVNTTLRELLYILAVPLTSILGLAAFETWWSAGLYVSGIGLAMIYTAWRREKHNRSQAYDDKLSAERMEAARKWLIND